MQIKRVSGGKPSLACVRADGSRTWSRVHPFQPIHDLTHYAVESVFGFSEAFFGLIATGWEIEAFAEPGAAAQMPLEAIVAEYVVGLLDLERGTGHLVSGAEVSATLDAALRGSGRATFRPVRDAELAAIRALRGALAARWRALAEGETLELIFPADLVRQPATA